MPVESIESTAERIRKKHGDNLARFFLVLVDPIRKDGRNISCSEGDATILAEYLRLHDTSLERVRGGYILHRHESMVAQARRPAI